MNHQEQTNHDKHPDESKTRTHRLSKLPDDGDPWAPNNLLTPEQKKNTSWTSFNCFIKTFFVINTRYGSSMALLRVYA